MIEKSKELFKRQRWQLQGPFTWSKKDEEEGTILDAQQQALFNEQEELQLA